MRLSGKKLNVKGITVIFALGAFLNILNQTILFTALPQIAHNFQISASGVQWLTTAYLLTNGVMIPLTAYLIDRFSTRQLSIFAFGMFALGTAIASFANSFALLLLARIIQAIGAGIVMPLMQVVFLSIYPVEKRGTVMGMIGLVVGFAPAIGPTLGGFILQALSWRYLFILALPFGILILLATWGFVQNVSEANSKITLDKLSVILSTLGFGLLLYGVSILSQQLLLSIIMLIVGLLFLIWFIVRQGHLKVPVLNFNVYRSSEFTKSLLLVILSYVFLIGIQSILPTYIQSSLGYSASISGLVLFPGALATAIASLVGGKLFDRMGGKVLAIVGTGLVAISMVPCLLSSSKTSIWLLSGVLVVTMIGSGLLFSPIFTNAIAQLQESQISHGTAQVNTFRQVGGSIGTALLVTVNSLVVTSQSSQIGGMHAVFGVVLVLAIIGLGIALSLKKPAGH